MKLPSIKSQLIIFLSGFAIFLSFQDKDALFLLATLVAVISAAIADSTITYFRTKKFSLGESSLITGLIIGFVLSSAKSPWIFALASVSSLLLGRGYQVTQKC